ncbi:hypothetical protein [Saccharothrix hoggarensis]|uniref:DUF8129 domain-containing protein n=1 Tax=Saccharothrix hoggarensis TaxID=913853 RepID=A0ABW3R5A7_9PSEU
MSHDDFPLPDYDQLPLSDLRHRIRSLDEDDLRRVRDHERDHGHRVPVLQLLDARLDELANGAEPSGGDQRNAPGVTHSQRQNPISPAHSPADHTPLRHGVHDQTRSR